MAYEPFYRTVSHRNDYTLADAMRPDPNWGRRRFTVPAAAVAHLSEAEMVQGAQEAAPSGYRLTRLEYYPAEGPERVIWARKPVTEAPHGTPA